MPRLPALTPESTADPALQDLFAGLRGMGLEVFANQLGTLAHHPALANAVLGVLRAYYEASTVPRRYLELVVLLVTARNRCDYCAAHHRPMGRKAGLSQAQLDAVDALTWRESDAFDETERAVLAFAEAVSAGGRMPDATFDALRAHFDERQIVELTVRTAMCEFFNRFNETFQLDVEPEAEALYRQTG